MTRDQGIVFVAALLGLAFAAMGLTTASLVLGWTVVAVFFGLLLARERWDRFRWRRRLRRGV